MVLGDVVKRFAELQGKRAVYLTGTDEHGMKVQRAAEKANTEPKAFCDQGADTFKVLWFHVVLIAILLMILGFGSSCEHSIHSIHADNGS